MKMFITALFEILKNLRKPTWLSLGKWLNKLWYTYPLKYYAVIQGIKEIYKYGHAEKSMIYYCLKHWKQRGYRIESKIKKWIVFFTFPLLNVYSQKKTENELKRHTLNMVLIFVRILHKPSIVCLDMPPTINALNQVF